MSERILSLLVDDSRFVRKKALTDVFEDLTKSGKSTELFTTSPATYASELCATLNDPIEVNRELAIKVNRCLIDQAQDCQMILPSLFPVLVKRLAQKEIVEPAEELRLELLKLVQLILQKGVDISPYIDDILLIIQHELSDPFHEAKKLCCILLQEVAQRKIYRFYHASESIVNPLVSNLVHQHSKVRASTVQAIGTLMIYGQGKLVDQVLTPLTQRLFDDSSSVRRCVIETVGSWLLDLPDRYSYHTKLLPLILSGLIDDSAEIRELTEEFWHDIGLKFEKENEEQMKDKLDFTKDLPRHHPLGCKRPLVGCRELVYRSASRILPALCRDLGDWQATTRSKAASLIPVFILHLEESATQHTQHLITGLATGLGDAIARIAPSTGSVALLRLVPPLAFADQPLPRMPLSVNQSGPVLLVPRIPTLMASGSAEMTDSLNVIHQLLLAAELTGALVESRLWWSLLKSCLDRCAESAAPASLAGHLFLLAAFISGASLEQLAYSEPEAPPTQETTDHPALTNGENGAVPPITVLHQIVKCLATNDMVSVISFGAKAALLECVLVVIRRLEESVVIMHDGFEQTDQSAKDGLTDVSQAATVLLSDTEIRSLLFQILLALGAVWADAEVVTTDFGTSLIQLTLEATRRLASCERDLENQHEPNGTPFQSNSYTSDLLKSASAADVDRLYTRHMLKLFQRLEADQANTGSWHPRSVGLAIFSRCLQTAGPALLMTTTSAEGAHDHGCLPTVLRLLEQGCRLNQVPGAGADKVPGGTDPLTMASEAELRLRGLMLLTRLTDNGPVRTVLSSPALLSRCLSGLVLPACVWRAGRTAEAMRKAAVTCLVALLAAATGTYDLDETNVDSRTADEVWVDRWLCQNIAAVQKLLGSQVDVNGTAESEPAKVDRRSSLPTLPADILSLVVTRLGGLLEDDLQATRRMACLSVTLLFNGLLLPSSTTGASDFLQSTTWLTAADVNSTTSSACPLPKSFGDQVYRFYPNLIKRLNDAKDPIRLLVTESLNAWLRITHRMLTCPGTDDGDTGISKLNSVHSAVVEDLLSGLMPHLDDANDSIRAAVARVVARIGRFAPELVRGSLTAAADRHRSPELCRQLVQLVDLRGD